MTKIETAKNIEHYLALPYTCVLRPDDEGDIVARIQELPGCIAHGETEVEALTNLREAQKLWIEDCLEAEQPVPEPEGEEELPSGKWLQRVPRTLHKKLSELAKKEGVSFNQLVTTLLQDGVTGKTWKDYMVELFSKKQPMHSVWNERFNRAPVECVIFTGVPHSGELVQGLVTANRLTSQIQNAYHQKEITKHTKERLAEAPRR